MLKSELRKIYLARQKELSSIERKQKSTQIAANLFSGFDLSKIRFVHCFLPIERTNEINTKLIFEKIWQEFPAIITLVPRVNFQAKEIENLKFTAETELIKSIWEIYEPSHDEIIETEEIDVVLIPLLAFDKRGFRVGYGKGFYDKFLINCRKDCLKIGLSYFSPVAEISDAQEFDVKLDFCITPEKIFKGKSKK